MIFTPRNISAKPTLQEYIILSNNVISIQLLFARFSGQWNTILVKKMWKLIQMAARIFMAIKNIISIKFLICIWGTGLIKSS